MTVSNTRLHQHIENVFSLICSKDIWNLYKWKEKSRIRETPSLSTDADSRTDTNLKRKRDLTKKMGMFGDLFKTKKRVGEGGWGGGGVDQ